MNATHPEIHGDVQLALDLAAGRSTGEAADALRARLRGHITAFTAPASRYAESLPPGPRRTAVEKALADGEQLATGAESKEAEEPAEELRHLARCVDYLSRCAAAAPVLAGRQHGESRSPAAPPPEERGRTSG